MIHELKCEVDYYRAVESGDKTFEIRVNDRGFQKGDIVHLKPWKLGYFTEPYAGMKVQITYVTGFMQRENWVVFGFRRLE